MAEIPSTYFPGQATADNFVMKASLNPNATPEDMVMINVSAGGQEQRRLLWATGGRRHFAFQTMPLTQDQGRQVRDFIIARRGQFEPFWFFWFELENFVSTDPLGVGISDGTTNLVCSAKNMTTPSAVRNVTQGVNLAFGFSAGYGAGGEGRLTALTPTPTTGDVIGATFTGNKRYVVRLENAKPSQAFFNAGNTKTPYPVWTFALEELV